MPGSLLTCFFKPDTNIQYFIQRILPHDMLKHEFIAAGSGEPDRFPGQQYPVFKYIVHAGTGPFILVGKRQVELLCSEGRVAGTFAPDLHPKVIIGESVRMADHEKDIVRRSGIGNVKTDGGFVGIVPGMVLQRYVFLEQSRLDAR
jgi:hypothetical protein